VIDFLFSRFFTFFAGCPSLLIFRYNSPRPYDRVFFISKSPLSFGVPSSVVSSSFVFATCTPAHWSVDTVNPFFSTRAFFVTNRLIARAF